MLLAGDVGGTKTSLAIISRERGPRSPLVQATFPSGRYLSLEALVEEFLGQVNDSVERACFGVAGPVVEGRANITNLPWLMEEDRLAAALNLRSVRLLNDLESIAYGVPILQAEDLHTVNSGKAVDMGAIAIVAPGTGLGEAFLTWDGARYRAHSSEGGHADFAPVGELQIGLLQYLESRLDHVSYEWVCSGLGLPNIYAYLKDGGYAEEPSWLAERLAEVSDPNPIIVSAAFDPDLRCDLCVAALELFVSILGAEAGNMALKVLSTGGVYIGGGIPTHILPALQDGRFMRAFLHKGRFADLLRNVPVHVILNSQVALFGAACHGLELL